MNNPAGRVDLHSTQSLSKFGSAFVVIDTLRRQGIALSAHPLYLQVLVQLRAPRFLNAMPANSGVDQMSDLSKKKILLETKAVQAGPSPRV